MVKVVKWLKVTKVVNGKNRNTVKMENCIIGKLVKSKKW
jgi:hypothetical protein